MTNSQLIRILYVEDQPYLQDLFKENFLLQKPSYQIDCAENYVEAEQMLRTNQYNCCVIDGNFPFLKGGQPDKLCFRLADVVKETQENVRLIVYTGGDDIYDEAENMDIPYLLKPPPFKYILELIVKLAET